MADRKISELTNITGANLADDDEFALVDTSADETKAITFGEFKTALDTATGFVRITGDTMTGNLTVPNVVVSGNVDGRDVSADGTKLDGIEAGADVTDTTNVTAAGALMDSELSNLAAVKAINQGLSTSDSPSFDAVTVGSTSDPSSEMTILSSIGGTSELRLGDTDADAGSIKYFNSNDQLVLRAAAATRVIFSSTGAAITGKTTTDELDLNAIAATISDTAVDIFVYDTRKDSDGGAWRKRTQHTSWYNETLSTSTRGSRKEFPAVAVIVAESNQVTIYDGDDPDLPMWIVFSGSNSQNMIQAGTQNSVFALNSEISLGSSGNLHRINFIADISYAGTSVGRYLYNGAVLDRNGANGFTLVDAAKAIISSTVNDVAMTVLPNAPIDAATGLPVPTIAVATDGGVSVIKDDGTVVDITNSNSSFLVTDEVTLDNSGRLSFVNSYSLGGNAWIYVFNSIPTSDNVITINTKTGSTQDADAMYDARGSASVSEDLVLVGPQDDIDASTGTVFGNASGISSVAENITNPASGMVAYITSDYNTGWQNGDIKLATLSDTDDTNVTGAELVTSWVNGTTYPYDTFTTSGSSITSAITDGSDFAGTASNSITVTSGKHYVVSFDLTLNSGTAPQVYFVNGQTGGSSAQSNQVNSVSGNNSITLIPTTTGTVYLQLRHQNGVSGNFSTGNISCRLAEPDRSVNGNGLQVFGTVTKSAVATGADLVAYGGTPSTSKYLYQPNILMDYTNDFCVMSWSPDGEWTWQLRDDDAGSFTSYQQTAASLYTSSNGSVYFRAKAYTQDLGTVGAGHIAVVHRASSGFQIYVNGVLKHSNSSTNTVADAYAYIGVRHYGPNIDAGYSNQSLFRISATAPSPEQIKKIYEDEKVLFQEGAQATLYGSSDAVTALAYDDSTNLLHVGTSAGRSVFQGLRRVDNTTTAVGAAISASNGLVADE